VLVPGHLLTAILRIFHQVFKRQLIRGNMTLDIGMGIPDRHLMIHDKYFFSTINPTQIQPIARYNFQDGTPLKVITT
jgi:hypothetical protein